VSFLLLWCCVRAGNGNGNFRLIHQLYIRWMRAFMMITKVALISFVATDGLFFPSLDDGAEARAHAYDGRMDGHGDYEASG
jgi:hypothetical protein